MNKQYPSRGEIWFADLDPAVGNEQAKKRPCLIISSNTFNHCRANLVTILPITSIDKKIPSHVGVDSNESGLRKKSFIICEQPRTISKQRLLGTAANTISEDTMETVETNVRHLLNL